MLSKSLSTLEAYETLIQHYLDVLRPHHYVRAARYDWRCSSILSMLQSTAENVKDQCLTVVGLADCDALGIPLAASWGPSPSAPPFELRLSDRCYAIWMYPLWTLSGSYVSAALQLRAGYLPRAPDCSGSSSDKCHHWVSIHVLLCRVLARSASCRHSCSPAACSALRCTIWQEYISTIVL